VFGKTTLMGIAQCVKCQKDDSLEPASKIQRHIGFCDSRGGPMLDLQQVAKSYGDNLIFSDLSIALEESSTYGLIGKNGAGKTTLLKIINRILTQHDGKVFLDNEDITGRDAMNLPFRFVSDTPSFFSDLTVEEHMLFVCKNRGLSKSSALEEIRSYADRLSLTKYADYYPQNLSRGTQQRLNIALSFFGAPRLSMFDEPFITLDPIQVHNLEDIMLERKNSGITQIISSHNLDSLERICDKYLIIHDHDISLFSKESVSRETVLELLDD
jgi:ABC-2 type transport system ATP-binding protein